MKVKGEAEVKRGEFVFYTGSASEWICSGDHPCTAAQEEDSFIEEAGLPAVRASTVS